MGCDEPKTSEGKRLAKGDDIDEVVYLLKCLAKNDTLRTQIIDEMRILFSKGNIGSANEDDVHRYVHLAFFSGVMNFVQTWTPPIAQIVILAPGTGEVN